MPLVGSDWLDQFANNGPDLLGRWGAGTEIGTALFWDRAPQSTTISARRTSQLRYFSTKTAAIEGINFL
jgi:hypothetical protein